MNLELYPRDIHNLYEYDLTQEEKDYFETEDTGLTACEKCQIIQRWEDEVYCKGEECWETNVILGKYDVVCDDCYYDLSKSIMAKLEIVYYKIKDMIWEKKNAS
tara:strand:- start:1649 stop:1960 length:312 start_codon:yes stop_codon:yes gene_type:complete